MYAKGKTDRRESFNGCDQSGSKGKKKDKKVKTKPKWKCFHCGKEGHIKKYCYDFLRKQKQGENGSVSVATTSNNACLSEVLTVSNILVPDEWILDSGCSFHMSPNRSWFTNFNEHESGTVYMGNNNTCTVQGIGDIKLKLHDGKIRLLTNVRYVPGLKRNLISLGTLDEIGFSYLAKNGCLHVTKNDCIVLSGIKKNGLYVLEGVYYAADDRTDSALVSDFNMTELWHLRLGHMSQKGIQILKQQGLLGNGPMAELKFCSTCILGKQHREKFPKGAHLVKACLDYIHADLWGPAKEATFGGNRYFLSIIDDFSRKVWVYLLKSKDQTLESFKTWKTLVENQVDRKVKCLRTDNGLEFCNTAFDNFCKENGILRHRTVPYTPQQNGVAERMNRTLLEKLRCILFTSGLPKSFWGEVLCSAVYLVNRSPSSAINFKCPEEKWIGRKPNLSHLKVVGCEAYCHKPEGKLDPRSIRGVMLGYQEGSKGYRVWDKNSIGIKVIVSRDVIFNEYVFPCVSTNTDAGSRINLPRDLTLTGGAQFEVELDDNHQNQLPSIQNQIQEPDLNEHEVAEPEE